MEYIADVHVHSRYSRATSRMSDLEHFDYWAQLKGVALVGTGDFTHPAWLSELQEKLVEAEPGLFRVKDEYTAPLSQDLPPSCRSNVSFILSAEISSIYKKGDRTRKVHNVVFMPGFNAAAKFAAQLDRIGNITSDGRPILGLDCRDLLQIVLETDPDAFLVPAHIWTPHFSVLGASTGFNALEECFEDLTSHIFAVETGLSSDPPMNWRLSALDRYTLISNSDAHSPARMMREANILEGERSFHGFRDALKHGKRNGWKGTIEFFPEEGKYHFDGHRKCQQALHPSRTMELGGLCPACGRKVTVGVLHRVESLADRPQGYKPDSAASYLSLVPLQEILAELLEQGPNTRKVEAEYCRLIRELGPEYIILTKTPVEDIAKVAHPGLAAAISRMRRGEITAIPGYDGQYGTIRTMSQGADLEQDNSQLQLFDDVRTKKNEHILHGLNASQEAAVTSPPSPLLILAGPGTGKTLTLTRRIAWQLAEHDLGHGKLVAVTFTIKAANEIRERMEELIDKATAASRIFVGTIHAASAHMLREHASAAGLSPDFRVIDEPTQRAVAAEVIQLSRSEALLAPQALLDIVAALKQRCVDLSHGEPGADSLRTALLAAELEDVPLNAVAQLVIAYSERLQQNGMVDFDDLVLSATRLFADPEQGPRIRGSLASLLVDEAQDLNEAQYRWLRALAAEHSAVTLVGDPDQSIYGFRGANARVFQRFLNDYSGARTVHLEMNYRSTPAILHSARAVIVRSPGRIQKQVIPARTGTRKVQLWTCDTTRTEAREVISAIEEIVEETSMERRDAKGTELPFAGIANGFDEIAILTRTNAQHFAFAEALSRAGIPLQAAAAVRKRPGQEVRRILDLLRMVADPDDPAAWISYLVEHVKGLGQAAAARLDEAARSRAASILKCIQENPGGILTRTQAENALAAIQAFKETRALLAQVGLRRGLEKLLDDAGLLQPGKHDPEADFLKLLAACEEDYSASFASHAESNSHLEPTVRPPNGSLEDVPLPPLLHVQVNNFISQATIRYDTDLVDPRARSVQLLTIHAAKGKEFPVVFLCGAEEGLLPASQALKEPELLEEERRIFYVGITRAKELLVITHCLNRFIYGKETPARPSRFLEDIPADHVERKEFSARVSTRTKANDSQLRLF